MSNYDFNNYIENPLPRPGETDPNVHTRTHVQNIVWISTRILNIIRQTMLRFLWWTNRQVCLKDRTWAGEQLETGRWHPRPPSEPWRPSAHPRWQSPWSSASWEEGWWEWKPSKKIMMIIKMIMMINLGSGIPCWLGLSSHRPLHLLRKSYILIIKVMIIMIMFMFWRWGGTWIRWLSRSDSRFLSSLISTRS